MGAVQYNPVSNLVVQELKLIVGDKYVIFGDREALEKQSANLENWL